MLHIEISIPEEEDSRAGRVKIFGDHDVDVLRFETDDFEFYLRRCRCCRRRFYTTRKNQAFLAPAHRTKFNDQARRKNP